MSPSPLVTQGYINTNALNQVYLQQLTANTKHTKDCTHGFTAHNSQKALLYKQMKVWLYFQNVYLEKQM